MTEEELEKEAEEIYTKTDKEFMDCQDEGEIFNLGYLAGAEPREKRIAELEDKLSRVKNILLSYIEWEDAVTESKVYVYEDIFVNAIEEIEK